jgi:hypothetical protein
MTTMRCHKSRILWQHIVLAISHAILDQFSSKSVQIKRIYRAYIEPVRSGSVQSGFLSFKMAKLQLQSGSVAVFLRSCEPDFQTLGKTKEHYQGFEQAPVGTKGHLPFVSFLHPNIIKTPPDVQLGEVSGSSKLGDEF